MADKKQGTKTWNTLMRWQRSWPLPEVSFWGCAGWSNGSSPGRANCTKDSRNSAGSLLQKWILPGAANCGTPIQAAGSEKGSWTRRVDKKREERFSFSYKDINIVDCFKLTTFIHRYLGEKKEKLKKVEIF